MAYTKEVRALRKLAKSWGGDIVRVSPEKFKAEARGKDFFEAPFTNAKLGVLWKTKKVLFVGDVPWGFLTHELGHLFASAENPERSKEFDFFGWEIVLARMVGDLAEWEKTNKDYIVTNCGRSLREVTKLQKDQVYKERIRRAEDLGILKNGIPVSISSSFRD
jgi:hypothetical protein